MKKNIVALTIIICLLSNIIVYSSINDDLASNTIKDLKIINLNIFENDTFITRNDCVGLIMKCIGVPDDVIVESYAAAPLFCDGDDFTYYDKYITSCKLVEGTAYVALATEFTDIVKGVEINDRNLIRFDFTRPVTTKETLAFMVRCLYDVGDADLDETFEKALEIGLIKEIDAFFEDSDRVISCEDFFALLQRFLYQRQYLYYSREGECFRKNIRRNMTYYEFLQE